METQLEELLVQMKVLHNQFLNIRTALDGAPDDQFTEQVNALNVERIEASLAQINLLSTIVSNLITDIEETIVARVHRK